MNSELEIRKLVGDVTDYYAGNAMTHYETCYYKHAGCLAVVIRDLMDWSDEDGS